jgi:hypothetical protein
VENETFQTWSTLHRRYVNAEVLSIEEQALYDAGCAELDAQETFDDDLERVRKLRAKLLEPDSELEDLLKRRAERKVRIIEFEAQLDSATREQLGVRS